MGEHGLSSLNHKDHATCQAQLFTPSTHSCTHLKVLALHALAGVRAEHARLQQQKANDHKLVAVCLNCPLFAWFCKHLLEQSPPLSELTVKHSQYFFRHALLLHEQPFRCLLTGFSTDGSCSAAACSDCTHVQLERAEHAFESSQVLHVPA